MRQRAMIAMALACNPRLLIADEPTTAVDVTIQAQVLELLRRLQRQYGMSMIMISHDLGVIAHLCDRVIVMYLGKVVEEGRFVDVYDDPLHPYTQALLESIPRIGERSRRRLKAIAGAVPDPYTRPAGCYFEPRCERAQPNLCELRQPPLVSARGRRVRCVLYGNGERGDG
jgi:peptide/nickel transport system ATP-binding protein